MMRTPVDIRVVTSAVFGIVAGLFLGWVLAGVFAGAAGYEPPAFTPPVDEDAEFAIFRMMVEVAEDPREAYLAFAPRFDRVVHPNEVHELFHRIGRYFHDEYGLRAVLLCDFQYNWGCFHGFVAQALERDGPDAVVRAAELCGERAYYYFGKCIHGLGQGILFTTGYTYDGIVRGLALCDMIPQEGRETCYKGVLKEYNDRSAKPYGGPSGDETVKRDPADVFGPCDRLDEQYLESCFYEQPYFWWRKIFDDDFMHMGSVCETVEDTSLREKCIRGVSRSIFGKTKYDPVILPPLCESYSRDEYAKWCFREGLGILAGTFSEKAVDPMRICELANSKWQSWCEEEITRYEKH